LISTKVIFGAIIGEWVGASQGPGCLMLLANGHAKIDLMFAALIVLAVFTLLLHMGVDRACRRWLDGRAVGCEGALRAAERREAGVGLEPHSTVAVYRMLHQHLAYDRARRPERSGLDSAIADLRQTGSDLVGRRFLEPSTPGSFRFRTKMADLPWRTLRSGRVGPGPRVPNRRADRSRARNNLRTMSIFH